MSEFTIDNAVSIFFSTLEYQNNYWTLYSAVGFGLLAFLGASKVQLSLIRLTVITFVAVSITNMVIISNLPSNLLVIHNGIVDYLGEHQSEVPEQFHQTLKNIGGITKPVWLVVLLHLLSTIAFSIAMFFAGNISPGTSQSQ